MLTISEIYPSLQGEGRLTGTPSVLIRTSGCNLRCDFCDTPFTSWHPEGTRMSVDAVVAEALRHGLGYAIVTGGEPMIAADLPRLCGRLAAAGLHVTIETAGTVDREVSCDLMSISPKLANSDPPRSRSARWAEAHPARRHRPDVVASLLDRHDCQLKYVVDRPEDVAEVERSLAEIAAARTTLAPAGVPVAAGPPPGVNPVRAAVRAELDRLVWLMPQGTDPAELAAREAWLEPICRERGWSLCRRKHIEWFGHTRRT